MAWMSDEAFDLKQENREKKITAGSARNRRGHTGKGGRVRLPSDNLTQKQWEAKNGECKTYRLGAPMDWDEFSAMPDDLKAMYVKNLRRKFSIPDEALATVMGVDISVFNECLRGLKLSVSPSNPYWYGTDDHGRFATWWINIEEEK